ncbi:hypothetical protein PMAYCL1PPCAC_09072, partial [Pristionchus mayeri]
TIACNNNNNIRQLRLNTKVSNGFVNRAAALFAQKTLIPPRTYPEIWTVVTHSVMSAFITSRCASISRSSAQIARLSHHFRTAKSYLKTSQ